MSKIGYIRVSIEHQETARQQEIMCGYQVDRIFSEKISGANKDRPQLRASTPDGNLSPPTGQGSGSSMGNGSRRISQGVTLCGEWACRQIPFTAVCVSMKSVTVSPSRPQHDRLANGNVPQSRPPLRSGKLTTEKKKPSETLTERFRELAVIRSNRVCACYGTLHNSDNDLC